MCWVRPGIVALAERALPGDGPDRNGARRGQVEHEGQTRFGANTTRPVFIKRFGEDPIGGAPKLLCRFQYRIPPAIKLNSTCGAFRVPRLLRHRGEDVEVDHAPVVVAEANCWAEVIVRWRSRLWGSSPPGSKRCGAVIRKDGQGGDEWICIGELCRVVEAQKATLQVPPETASRWDCAPWG